MFKLVTPVFMPYASENDLTPVWPNTVPLPDFDKDGDRHFKFTTRGPWGIVNRVVGLAVESAAGGVIVYGDRSMDTPKESGYQMEGRLSIGGAKHRTFTSSKLFLINGKLHNIGILYVCRRDIRMERMLPKED